MLTTLLLLLLLLLLCHHHTQGILQPQLTVSTLTLPIVENTVGVDSISDFSRRTGPANAADGDNQTAWISANNLEQWVVFDLKRVYTVSKVRLLSSATRDAPQNCVLQTVDSEGNFIENVFYFTAQQTGEWQEFGGFYGDGRYWRIVAVTNYGSVYTKIAEVEFYAAQCDVTVDDDGDCAALVSLFYTFGAQETFPVDGDGAWLQGNTSMCDWDLVTCNATDVSTASTTTGGGRRVTHLDLYNRRLCMLQRPARCSIPRAIRRLTAIRYLNLGNNRIGGVVPAIVGESLTSLEVLHLGNNKFHGWLPDSIGANLKNLTELYIYYNHLFGEMPDSFGGLTNLKIMALHMNHLSGELPPSLRNLTKLELINLRGNQFVGSAEFIKELLHECDSGCPEVAGIDTWSDGAGPLNGTLRSMFLEDNKFEGADEGIASIRPRQAVLLCMPGSLSPDCVESTDPNPDSYEHLVQDKSELFDATQGAAVADFRDSMFLEA